MYDSPVTGASEKRQSRWCRRKWQRVGGVGGVGGGRAVNKHIFMYGFRLRNALPPQV